MIDAGERLALRPEEPSDEGFCLRLFASTRAAEIACLGGAPGVADAFVRMQHEAQRRGYQALYPGAERAIVLLDGAPVGRIIVDRTAAPLRLVDVALLPEHRGRGTGAALLGRLLGEARRAGREVVLSVLRGSPAARLYARLGFVNAGGTEVHEAMKWSPGD